MTYRLSRRCRIRGIKRFSLLDVLSLGAVFFLWFAAAFDPIGDMWGVRYLALAFALGVLVLKFTLARERIPLSAQYKALFFLFVVFIPLYGLVVGIARGGMSGKFIDTSYISSALYFLCSLLYFDDHLDIEIFLKIVRLVLRLLCMLVYACLATVVAGLSQDWIYYILIDRGLMFFGMRQYGGLTLPYLYIITTPMLILLLSYDAWNLFERPSLKRLGVLLFTAVALFLSGTRAHMIISTFGLVFLWLWHRYRRLVILYALALLVAGMLIFTVFEPGVIADMFSPEDVNNAQKISYLSVYQNIFSDPLTLIGGQGFNAHVWSNEFSVLVNNGEASKTELTYLEYMRVFGFFGVLVLLAIAYIAEKGFGSLSWSFQWICPALLLYLAISAFNPYIFSSNGMMVFGLCTSICTIDVHRRKASRAMASADATART